ncbi:ADP-ribosyl cyclase/cyclic ADP-ribose hydrolase-like [Acanthaster planci]|uniref:ADP-ribosyl cyclase/cyclic ADP-ribose hydrolase-like n=1 Tax=Acanthaster planci TaxID=133434 RepID=A0A8B7YPK9_ACAPL|nr:ADP-ribosyl cyclase/cyclic ADP-ribose hydrolase-like [Acanthaster planci]
MGRSLLCISLCILLPLFAGGHMISYRSADRSSSVLNQQPEKGPTTPNISDIFIGRCYEHIRCLQQDQCITNTLRGSCDNLWVTFRDAFANKDPCQAGYGDYDGVITAAMPHTNRNKTLFWSGLKTLALDNGRVTRNHTILEETLPGYIANGLTWCGQTGAPGINYDTPCPASTEKNNETMYTFWKAASRAFARQARGVVAVALNGSREDAFRHTSTFATTELPNIESTAVTHVNILLVYDISIPGNNRRARCDEGSIKDLQSMLTDKGLSYNCVEDPPDFKYLQCAKDPRNDRCIQACSSAMIPNINTALIVAASLVFHLVTGVRD